MLLKFFLIQINPRFSVPRRNLENTTIFVSQQSLGRMGPVSVVASTQEGQISPVLSKSTQKRLPEVLLAVATINIPDLKKDILYNLLAMIGQ